jgi:hypothetical protein
MGSEGLPSPTGGSIQMHHHDPSDSRIGEYPGSQVPGGGSGDKYYLPAK